MRSTILFFACFYAAFQFSNPTASIYGTLECEEDSDCLAADAYCDTTRLCECPSGLVFSTNGSLCLQYVTEYNGNCVDSEQCAWLQGKYACLGGLCTCDEGWRWYQGRCIEAKGFNETCSRDLDCYNGYDVFAMSCINGTCQCSSDYYLRGDYDCRPASYSENDECALDSDCRFEGASCQNARCKTSTVKVELEVLKFDTRSSSYVLDADCESDSDCSDNNSVCYPLTKKCICKRGYFYDSTGCIGELGIDVGCESDSDCPIKPGRCIDGACYCTRFRYYGDGNSRCYKSMTQTNWNCTSNEWCYALGSNAYCNAERSCACSGNAVLDENYVCQTTGESQNDGCQSDNDCLDIANSQCVNQICVCKDNYREEDGSCLPNIGAACDESSPCTIEYATCDTTNVCSCSNGYVSDGSVTCLASAANIGDECVKAIQCDHITNTECADGRCSCIESFSEYNGTCYEIKAMGSYCANRFHCNIFLNETVECRNSKCQCAVGYTSTDDGLGCRISAASSFGGSGFFYLWVVAIFTAVIIFE